MTKGVNLSAYRLQAKILQLVVDTEVLPYDVSRINVTCSVSCSVNDIWLESMFTERSRCSSDLCPAKVRINTFRTLTVQFSNSETVIDLERAVNQALQQRTTNCCTPITEYIESLTPDSYIMDKTVSLWPICSGIRTITTTVDGCCLFAEVIQPTPHGTVEVQTKLCDVQTVMFIGKSFNLRGLIGFCGGKSASSVGYYTAFCRRNDGRWQLFDNLRNSVGRCKDSEKVCIHPLLYTT